ncbi:MAG: precorrin-8X methylmutase [Pseudomonadota bacterium]
MRPYEKDPQAIYTASFATVRHEANLGRFPPDLAEIAVRVIHACGMVEVADRLAFSPDVAERGIAALRGGAPIYADCEMVAAGITRRLLPPGAAIRCTLNDPATPDRAQATGTTRSAAAVDLWDTDGAIIAIGNAPTALFRLLERLDDGVPRPAAILAFPVGFVGAAESKAELAERPRATPFLTLRGRRGGSAMASAAVNALAILAGGGMQ